MTKRAPILAAAGLAGALLLTGCEDDTDLTNADQAGVPTEELVGEEMTLTNEVEGVFGEDLVTIGGDETLIFVESVPDGLAPGDTVEVTGTVASGDPLDVEDMEWLKLVTDDETATYLVERGQEPYLTGATLTVVG